MGIDVALNPWGIVQNTKKEEDYTNSQINSAITSTVKK